MQILNGQPYLYMHTKKWENCGKLFTQNVLLIQENCVLWKKIAQVHKFVKIALSNFEMFLVGLIIL